MVNNRNVDWRIATLSLILSLSIFIAVDQFIIPQKDTLACGEDISDCEGLYSYAVALEKENARLNRLLHEYRGLQCPLQSEDAQP